MVNGEVSLQDVVCCGSGEGGGQGARAVTVTRRDDTVMIGSERKIHLTVILCGGQRCRLSFIQFSWLTAEDLDLTENGVKSINMLDKTNGMLMVCCFLKKEYIQVWLMLLADFWSSHPNTVMRHAVVP